MRTKFWIILVLLMAINLACGGNYQASPGGSSEAYYDYATDSEAQMTKEVSAEEGGQPGSLAPEKKVIRTANMRMEVKDYQEALSSIRKLVATYEAEITNENEQQYGERLENNLVIRVLPQRFDSLLSEFGQLAVHVDFKSINTGDVTRQYIDLETRLASKRAVVERYRELLKQAKNVQEVLAVEENMRKVVEEIESIEGQLRYLSREVNYSTIHLAIFEKGSQLGTGPSFWARIGEGFENGWKLLKEMAVGTVTIWPVLLLLGALLFWILRRKRKPKGN